MSIGYHSLDTEKRCEWTPKSHIFLFFLIGCRERKIEKQLKAFPNWAGLNRKRSQNKSEVASFSWHRCEVSVTIYFA
jgi:hypothetical protein